MTDHHEIWMSQARWRDSWVVVRKLRGGGQGNAWRVRRKLDDREGFLKAIKAKRDPERRARFSREANAYGTITVRGIPRLIESNTHRWEEAEVEPYIVTEFIEGSTLRQWRENRERVELDEAIGATRELLAILSKCHDAGLVHRDVKPDNIILADDDLGRPVLLDFGLSFRKGSEIAFATEHGQEIGNRFLRLPELSAGSLQKRDVRSDLSFVAGILFYLLTGQHPDILQDAEGRLPHQRDEALAMLQELVGARLPRLRSLFDSAFEPLIGNRFASADAMLASMERVMEPRAKAPSAKSLLQGIREAMNSQAAQRQEATYMRLSEALKQIYRAHGDARKTIGIALATRRSDHSIAGNVGKETLGWIRPGDDDPVLSVTYEVQEAGDEIVIQLSGDPVYRTPITSPRYGDAFDEAIREWLIDRLHEAVTNQG